MTVHGARRIDEEPERIHRVHLVYSLITLFVALGFWFVVLSMRVTVVYEQLGMTEASWPTELARALGKVLSYALPMMAVILIPAGAFALKRGKCKTLRRLTNVNWIMALLLSGYVYLCVHSLVDLEKKLESGSLGSGGRNLLMTWGVLSR